MIRRTLATTTVETLARASYRKRQMKIFSEKHAEWMAELNGDDSNAIFRQISHLSWNIAAYRTVQHARLLLPADERGGVELNPMVHHLFDECFFTAQAIAVRRLTENGQRTGKKAVYSLRTLVEDMRRHRHLLTRENFLRLDNLPFDCAATAKAEWEHILSRESGPFSVPAHLDAFQCELRNAQVDKLCGATPETRQKSDLVLESVLDNFVARLEEAQGLGNFVNKVVAHLARPESRAQVSADDLRPTFQHLWRAYEVICRVANLLDVCFLARSSHNFVPMFHGDQLVYIERPLVTSENVERLRDQWNQWDKETASWSEPDLEWLTTGRATPRA